MSEWVPDIERNAPNDDVSEMKGIDKKKHEHLMDCLTELRQQTSDPAEISRIDAEAALLSGTYEQYTAFFEGLRKESERYNSRYPEIQRRIYKEIRRIRFAQRRKI